MRVRWPPRSMPYCTLNFAASRSPFVLLPPPRAAIISSLTSPPSRKPLSRGRRTQLHRHGDETRRLCSPVSSPAVDIVRWCRFLTARPSASTVVGLEDELTAGACPAVFGLRHAGVLVGGRRCRSGLAACGGGRRARRGRRSGRRRRRGGSRRYGFAVRAEAATPTPRSSSADAWHWRRPVRSKAAPY
jgi:hypothetical protein